MGRLTVVVAVVFGVVALIGARVERNELEIQPATMAATLAPENHPVGDAFVLRAEGSISARLRFRSVGQWRLRFAVRARPDAKGNWPALHARLPGMLPRTITVAGSEERVYEIGFTAEPGFADLTLALTNAGPHRSGMAMTVEHIEIAPVT